MKESKCEICEKVFMTEYKLLNHYNHQHNNSGKLHHCNICTKSFQMKQSLTFHIKTVHGRKKIQL